MMTRKTIKSPEEVTLLLENMWFRHMAGMHQRSGNVFWVDMPPLTEEEEREIEEEKREAFRGHKGNSLESEDFHVVIDDDDEDDENLYCVEI